MKKKVINFNASQKIILPLTEWSTVDDNNSSLSKSLCPHHLVVGSIVHNIENTSWPGNGLTAPGEASSVKPQSPALLVATPGPNSTDTVRHQPSICCGSGQLELPLLSDWVDLSTGLAAFMPTIP